MASVTSSTRARSRTAGHATNGFAWARGPAAFCRRSASTCEACRACPAIRPAAGWATCFDRRSWAPPHESAKAPEDLPEETQCQGGPSQSYSFRGGADRSVGFGCPPAPRGQPDLVCRAAYRQRAVRRVRGRRARVLRLEPRSRGAYERGSRTSRGPTRAMARCPPREHGAPGGAGVLGRAAADTVAPRDSSARGRRRVREGDVELRYHGGPLAYRAANPLDGPRSYIAHGEHAQDVRLQWQWPLLVIVRSRQNESLCVQSDPAAAQPLRRRIRAYEEKDIADRQLRLFTGGHAPPAHTLQMRSRRAAQRDELRPRQHFDRGGGRDAVDEVARHGRGEPVSTQQDRHARGVSRQEHRGLAGRIAAPHQRNVFLPAHARLDGRGPVPDAPALELLEAGDGRPPVASAAGHDGRPGLRAPAVRQLESEGDGSAIEPRDLVGNDHLGPELLRLHEGAAGQRLSADCPRVEDDHREAFGGGIHRGRQTGGSSADDGDVVGSIQMIDAQDAEAAGQLDLGGIVQNRSIGTHDKRHVGGSRRVPREDRRRVWIIGGIEHLERGGVSGEKALQAQEVETAGRPNEDRPAGAHLDQAYAAQDERVHDALADVGLGYEQGPQPVGRNEERLHVAGRARVDEGWAAGQLARFGDEIARPFVDDVDDPPQTLVPRDGDGAGDEDEHARPYFARREQRLASCVAPNRAETAETVDLLRTELREHLAPAGLEGRHQSVRVRFIGLMRKILLS